MRSQYNSVSKYMFREYASVILTVSDVVALEAIQKGF